MTTCPVCGRPAPSRDSGPAPTRESGPTPTRESRIAPFCSPRCADVDLGRWFTGQYRVPVDEEAAAEVPEVDRADGNG